MRRTSTTSPVLPHAFKTLMTATALLALAGCGGGDGNDSTETGAVQFAAQVRALGVPQAGAVQTLETPGAVTATMVLDWAEYKFPELFPRAIGLRLPAVLFEGVLYNARAYNGRWGVRYLGITPDGRIFGLGDFTGGALQEFNTIGFWSAQVLADECAVNPARCSGTNPPVGAFNGCGPTAQQAHAPGTKLFVSYVLSGGGGSGQFTINAEVLAAGTFNGQPAARLFSRTEVRTTFNRVTNSSVTETTGYQRDAGAGFSSVIGVESRESVPGAALPGFGTPPATVTTSRTVFDPGSVNVELSIPPGQSINKVVRSRTSFNGGALPLTPTSFTETHTFVRRETITVRGRSYNTCRYLIRNSTGLAGTTITNWLIDGRGVAARTEAVSTESGGTQTIVTELVSGSINGVPL